MVYKISKNYKANYGVVSKRKKKYKIKNKIIHQVDICNVAIKRLHSL